MAKYIKGQHASLETEFRKGENLGENHPRWNGGEKETFGYVLIYSPNHPNKRKDNYCLEHRLVMEKKLGRYLEPNEVVHHINGIRNDNRIENLVLCQSNTEHKKYHKQNYYCSDCGKLLIRRKAKKCWPCWNKKRGKRDRNKNRSNSIVHGV